MQPLKITFHMRSPVCLSHPWIHFDAILAHLYLRKNYPDYRSLPSKRVVELDYDLPLKRSGDVYHASVSFFDVTDYFSTTIYKRFCEKHLDAKRLRKKKIDRGRGKFKDFMIQLIYIPATRVTFYANGDPDEIQDLLKGMAGLGKKTAIGYGSFRHYEIEEAGRDCSLVMDGKAMRPIPVRMLREYDDVAILAYKPPYWDVDGVEECAPPGANVVLKEVV